MGNDQSWCRPVMDKWDERFLGLAEHISKWSKDWSTKVGAVITKGNRIISLGYNGFPFLLADDGRLLDRDTKNKITLHAEENCILFAKQDLKGCTIYTYPFPPCSKCSRLLIQSEISRVVSLNKIPERWAEDMDLAKSLMVEAGMRVDIYETEI